MPEEDGYTSRPTHIRIYKDEIGDGFPWCIDGADNEGNYTEAIETYISHAVAVEHIPMFVNETMGGGVVWVWEAHRGVRTPVKFAPHAYDYLSEPTA